ncbi:MAG: hypothetical protein RLP44_13795 [Aggregatilineales bacterium]
MSSIGKPSALVKPKLESKFHIDYQWWERSTEDLRVYLLSHVQPDQRDRISQSEENQLIDYIDPDSAEVFELDELKLAIQIAAKTPDFINPQNSLVDNVFRVFLRNNNTPMTPLELADEIGRPAETILKTFSGLRIYKGIRPIS